MAILRAVAVILFVYGLARLMIWAGSWLLLSRGQRMDGLAGGATGAAAVWLVPFAVFWDRPSPRSVVSSAMAAGLFAHLFARYALRGPEEERPPKLFWAIAAALLLQAGGHRGRPRTVAPLGRRRDRAVCPSGLDAIQGVWPAAKPPFRRLVSWRGSGSARGHGSDPWEPGGDGSVTSR